MKICAACCIELPKEKFSNKQWKLNAYQRRCIDCIDADREVQVERPAPENGPACWICLEEGVDDSGGPLQRDCSCRGESAGFAHLACLLNYAKHQFGIFLEDRERNLCPWDTCPTCLQNYNNNLAVILAKEFVIFQKKKYPQEIYMGLHAQTLLLEALTCKNSSRSTEQYEEARQVANTIITMAKKRPSTFLAFAYEILGCMLLEQQFSGTDDHVPKIVEYLEKALSIYKRIDIPDRVAHLEGLIASAASKEDAIELCEESYLREVAESGDSSYNSLLRGRHLGGELMREHYGVRAEKLLKKLSDISERTLGSKNAVHKDLESLFGCCRVRALTRSAETGDEKQNALTFTDYDRDGELHYNFLRYDGSFHTLLIEGPCSSEDPDLQSNELRVHNEDVIFALGTPVISHDAVCFGELGDIISWDDETKCYTIRWEDESLEPCQIPRDKIRIPRCLCDECMGCGGNPFPLKDKKIPETAEEDDRMMWLARVADTMGKLSDKPPRSLGL